MSATLSPLISYHLAPNSYSRFEFGGPTYSTSTMMTSHNGFDANNGTLPPKTGSNDGKRRRRKYGPKPQPPYTCFCGKVFKRHEHMLRHRATHDDSIKYDCHICGKSFRRQDVMHRHTLTHANASSRAASATGNTSHSKSSTSWRSSSNGRGRRQIKSETLEEGNNSCVPCQMDQTRCDGKHPCSRCSSSLGRECYFEQQEDVKFYKGIRTRASDRSSAWQSSPYASALVADPRSTSLPLDDKLEVQMGITPPPSFYPSTIPLPPISPLMGSFGYTQQASNSNSQGHDHGLSLVTSNLNGSGSATSSLYESDWRYDSPMTAATAHPSPAWSHLAVMNGREASPSLSIPSQGRHGSSNACSFYESPGARHSSLLLDSDGSWSHSRFATTMGAVRGGIGEGSFDSPAILRTSTTYHLGEYSKNSASSLPRGVLEQHQYGHAHNHQAYQTQHLQEHTTQPQRHRHAYQPQLASPLSQSQRHHQLQQDFSRLSQRYAEVSNRPSSSSSSALRVESGPDVMASHSGSGGDPFGSNSPLTEVSSSPGVPKNGSSSNNHHHQYPHHHHGSNGAGGNNNSAFTHRNNADAFAGYSGNMHSMSESYEITKIDPSLVGSELGLSAFNLP